MDYIAALTPSVVMAVAFTAMIITIIKSQGGPNKSKEDAAAEAAFLRSQGGDSSENATPAFARYGALRRDAAYDEALRKNSESGDTSA